MKKVKKKLAKAKPRPVGRPPGRVVPEGSRRIVALYISEEQYALWAARAKKDGTPYLSRWIRDIVSTVVGQVPDDAPLRGT